MQDNEQMRVAFEANPRKCDGGIAKDFVESNFEILVDHAHDGSYAEYHEMTREEVRNICLNFKSGVDCLAAVLPRTYTQQAALSNVPVDEWLDISSAPKDGTPILIYPPYEEDGNCKSSCSIAYFINDRDHGGIFTCSVQQKVWSEWLTTEDQKEDIMKPTHWRSLPIPPIIKGDISE